MNKPYRRRHYFIEKQTQGRFILRFVAISLAGGLLAVGLFVYLGGRKMEELLYSMILPQKSAAELLLPELLWINAAILIFIASVLLITTRKYMQQFNGPLKKITSDLKKSTDGDLTIRVSLRKDDAFQDVAHEMREMIKDIHGTMSTIRHKTSEISQLLTHDEDPATILKAVHELETCTKRFLV